MRGLIAAIALLAGPAWAADSERFQDRYCAGMQQEKYLPFGGRYDCLSDTHAIEVEWFDEWYSAVGQALYYAEVTDRLAGIILLCPSEASSIEFECRSEVYRLNEALKRTTPITVWECFTESDMSLEECDRLDLPEYDPPP